MKNIINIKNIFTIVIILILCFNPIYASQAKWDMYPEWGTMLEIYLISLWISIPLAFINIILSFILKKKEDNKIYKHIKRYLNLLTLVLFYSTIVGKIIVELDITQNSILYYLIFMIIGTILFIVFRNKKLFNNIITFIVMLIILAVILLTNAHIFPYEYNDVPYSNGITLEY